jgi:hypothetical protein
MKGVRKMQTETANTAIEKGNSENCEHIAKRL